MGRNAAGLRCRTARRLAEESRALSELLAAEEWESDRASTLNAHYTSPETPHNLIGFPIIQLPAPDPMFNLNANKSRVLCE
jgi:hypothetical protein